MNREQKYKLFKTLAIITGGFSVGLWLGYFLLLTN